MHHEVSAGPATLGYILKRFPRLSETFVVNEILAREAQGEQIAIASLRTADDERFHSSLSKLRAGVTWIPRYHGHGDSLWATLRDSAAALPRLNVLLPELLAHDPEEVLQAVQVARWARERGVTHLHAHFASSATTTARLASRLTGVPYSFTAHAKDIFHRDVDPSDLRGKLADADHVVTVSDFNVEFLRERYGDAATGVRRVHNGVPAGEIELTSPVERAPEVVFVGRLVDKKGVPDLIDAMAVLRDRGHHARLHLVGGGPLEGQIRAQVQRLSLERSVVMHGPQSQDTVHTFMRRAAVLAAPCVVAESGDRDGLPTVLLEAMAMGTPCVATPVTGIPEAVQDGVTGLLAPERDPFALAERIGRLLSDPGLRGRLATRARELIEKRFDVALQARELRALRPDLTIAHATVGESESRPTSAPAEVG